MRRPTVGAIVIAMAFTAGCARSDAGVEEGAPSPSSSRSESQTRQPEEAVLHGLIMGVALGSDPRYVRWDEQAPPTDLKGLADQVRSRQGQPIAATKAFWDKEIRASVADPELQARWIASANAFADEVAEGKTLDLGAGVTDFVTTEVTSSQESATVHGSATMWSASAVSQGSGPLRSAPTSKVVFDALLTRKGPSDPWLISRLTSTSAYGSGP